MPPHRRIAAREVALTGLVLLVVGCTDTNGLPAPFFANEVDTVSLYALRGTALTLPSVINGLVQLGQAGGRGEFGTGVLEFGSGLAVVSVLNADALLVVLVRPSTNVGALLYDLRRHRSAIAGLL